jgi:hypothetical protein
VLFLVALGSLALGGFVILLLARYAPNPNENVMAVGRVLPGGQEIPYDEFRALLIDLMEALKLEIVVIHGDDEMFDMIVRSNEPVTGGRFVVHAIWRAPGDIVDQPYVLRLADAVRGDGRAGKGILLTPYTIRTDGLGNLEVPVEMIDGRKLRGLVETHLEAKRLDHLAKYRGFGM